MIGQTLGHYKILDKLGAGGMGEVYLAEDTTLDRKVAVKVLPAELATSQERLDRFQREAKTLAALDHPNIVTIHSVEEAQGVRFLTMQLVEGKRLSDWIPEGGMSLERIFGIAIPLADALAAAHEKGIIHRDLKPGNIMLSDEGRVKVLDFGLAKLRQEAETPIATQLPTEPLTEEGRAIGTVPYMSPEQVEGKDVDHRSDLFSLGILLYEMATGQRPFQGDSPASVMSAILRDTPSSVTELSASLPRDLAKIIRRCLVKEPERRFQTARELAIELEELQSEVASGEAWETVARPPKRRRAMIWGLLTAAAVLLVAIAVVIWTQRSDQEPAPTSTSPVNATFTKLVFDTARKGKFSASPDGNFFVYASDALGNWDIYLQRIGGGKAINLTEDSTSDDTQPSFSADGKRIAFRSERNGGGIFIMGATGESVRRVTDHGFLPDWSPDGTRLVYSTSGRLGGWLDNLRSRIWIVDLSTGDSQMILDRSAIQPDWSPNCWRIAYQGWWKPSEAEQQLDLFTVSADGGDPASVTEDGQYSDSHAWSPDGQSLFFVSERGGTSDLWRVPIEERTGRVLGPPIAVTSGSSVGRHLSPVNGSRILYSTDTRTSEIFKVPFDPVTETIVGPPVSITSPSRQAWFPSVSSDGEWVAFDADFGQPDKRALGVIRADGTDLRQLTDGEYRDRFPRWSPDGRQLAFWGNRSGIAQAWIINTDGSGMRLLTDTPDVSVGLPIWSPDGTQLALCGIDGKTSYVFQADKPWSEEPPSELPPFGDSEDMFCPLSWSPDGKHLAGAHYEESFVERPAVYSFESETYRTPADELTSKSLWTVWLNDSRRILINAQQDDGSELYLLDTESGESQKVLSSTYLSKASGPITGLPSISADNQTLYVSRLQRQNEIWMLTLGREE